jgi:uncharacterized protein
MEAMKAALLAEGAQFSIFGGEALLVPLDDLNELWRFGLEHWSANGIQSNGSLITPEHVESFKQYRVHVGLSIDGPGELNDARWAGSLEKTRAATARSLAALDLLRNAGVAHSLIVTLHRLNASPERLPRLLAWLRELDAQGLRSARVHALEVDHPDVADSLELSPLEQMNAMLAISEAEAGFQTLRLDTFGELRSLLALDPKDVTCLWNACDPYTTSAVRGVDGRGNRTNCGRVSKDGVRWLKGETAGKERQLALYHTPQQYGGCKGCRFFAFCRGSCPGTAIDGDWRNRSAQCAVWMALFEDTESRVANPASRRPDLPKAEATLVAAWAEGRDMPTWRAFQPGANTTAGGAGSPGHADTPHQDWHQDHSDAALGAHQDTACRLPPDGAPGGHQDTPHVDWHHDGAVLTGQLPVGRAS